MNFHRAITLALRTLSRNRLRTFFMMLGIVVGISPAEATNAISLLLDLWRRSQILFVPNDPIYSHYHAKDDPYIQAGLLPLREFRPEGVLLTAGQNDQYARGLLAQRGASSVQARAIRRRAS